VRARAAELVVAGAGMAGLCAAARARELGAEPVVLEKGPRAGGSMRRSSGVVWRHATLARFREECPGGDPALQALVFERLDDALDWLESLGAPVLARETGNPRTRGRRLDPEGLTEALVRAAGDVRLGSALPDDTAAPLVLATGGFAARMARERGLLLRGNPCSDGAGIAYARARGAALTAGLEEFYGRNMPAPPARIGEREWIPLAQVYGRHALVLDEAGEAFFPGEPSWSENDLVQATARRPGGTAWYVVEPAALGKPTPYGTVADSIERARRAGGVVEERGGGSVAVRVAAAVTHTIGGLRVDAGARVLDDTGTPLPGLYAAGADAGGIATGGYSSGLAAALVLGLAAAESAVSDG
jgi:succinate dehydrogenase/fumarate reductase flavoprotein subunit